MRQIEAKDIKIGDSISQRQTGPFVEVLDLTLTSLLAFISYREGYPLKDKRIKIKLTRKVWVR